MTPKHIGQRLFSPAYGTWLVLHQPEIWREIVLWVAQQEAAIVLDFSVLAEYLRENADREGLKSFLEAVGIQQAVEAVGTEHFWAGLSLEQREELRRLAQQDKPAANEPPP